MRWRLGGAAGGAAVGLLALGMTVIADPFSGRSTSRRAEIPIEIATNGEEVIPGRVLLRLNAPLPPPLVTALHAAGVDVEERLEGGIDVLSWPPVAPPDLVAEAFSYLNEVEFCEPDYIAQTDAPVYPMDPSLNAQWHLSKIDAPTAWGISQGYSTVKIAVVDSGVDPTHPDLVGKVVSGFNFIRGNTNTTDDEGHGTHVAGICGAATNNAYGVAGVGYDCSILPVKVLDATGRGSYATIAAGINYAARSGAKVINLSLSGTLPSATLDAAVTAATRAGCLVIAAAGNSNSTTPQWPAGLPGVLSVGATTPSDDRASFSNYGSGWVDLAAPGTSILSTFPTLPMTLGSYPSGFASLSGTSMSTPVVSGVAALLYAYLGANATPQAVRAYLEATANPVTTPWTGFGRVDAGAALSAAARLAGPLAGIPRGVLARSGRWRAGDVSSVSRADSAAYEVTAAGPFGMRATELEIDVDGLSGIITEASIGVRTRTNVYARQTLSVYNWRSGKYDVVDRAFTLSRFANRSVRLTGSVNAYIRSGLMRIRLRHEAGLAFYAALDAISVTAIGS